MNQELIDDFTRLMLPDCGGDHIHIDATIVESMIQEQRSDYPWSNETTRNRERIFYDQIEKIRAEFAIPTTCAQCNRQIDKARDLLHDKLGKQIVPPSKRKREVTYRMVAGTEESHSEHVSITLQYSDDEVWEVKLGIKAKKGDPETSHPYVIYADIYKRQIEDADDNIIVCELVFPSAARDTDNLRWPGSLLRKTFDYRTTDNAQRVNICESKRSFQQYQTQLEEMISEIDINVLTKSDQE